MAKLESIEHKIFASEAPLDEIGQFGSALDTTKLNTKDVTAIQALPAYTKGWGSAIISNNNYPTMEEMNGVLNVMSYHTGYLYQEGMPAWRSDREYSATSIVKEPTGTKFFHSLKDGNIGNTLDNTEYWEELKFGGSGLEVCDIGTALYVDETKGLRRYLNGQIIDINTNTQAFLNRLKQITTLHPSLLCTEEEWQTAKTMSAFGQVGKFVFNYSGDEVVSVRIPRVVNVQGLFDLQNLGMTVSAGLPNIVGSLYYTPRHDFYGNSTGAFKNITTGASACSWNTRDGGSTAFDASLSNPIYGNSDTVQPEAIQYPYFIQIATGSETENNIINDIELNNPFSFGDSKYSPIELNNISFLKSNSQWNPKATYPDYYNWILENVNNGVADFKLSTDTYDDYSWVINTAEETFRLPLLDGSESLSGNTPEDITYNGHGSSYTASKNGIYSIKGYGATTWLYLINETSNERSSAKPGTLSSEDSWCSIEAKKGDVIKAGYYNGTVTQFTFTPAIGNGSLYFYVGETVQNANLIDAGRIGEQLANKQDKCIHITETYVNGTSGYRIWSDGYCEQWGYVSASSTVSLLKLFANVDYYNVTASIIYNSYTNWSVGVNKLDKSTFYLNLNTGSRGVMWRASGYLAEGEY